MIQNGSDLDMIQQSNLEMILLRDYNDIKW